MQCKQCQKEFESNHGNRIYCSEECKIKVRKLPTKEEKKQNERSSVKSGLRAYYNILARCNNSNHPKYYNYGARGIKCLLTLEEFRSIYFSSSACEYCGCKLNDENRNAKDGRNLDRISENGNYEKGNLRLLCRSCNISRGAKKTN